MEHARPELTARAAGLSNRTHAELAPPTSLKLAEWAESNIALPAGQSVRPGAYRNWPYMVEPLNAIGAPGVEYVTVMKATRLGFTKGLMIAIGAAAAVNPCSIGLLVPTDGDIRDYTVDELEPLFEASPGLRGLMVKTQAGMHVLAKNTMTRKSFIGGGSLKVLSARAPRKLRRHDFKILLADEVDAMELTPEGDPLAIAEARTFAHADRKIVRGSTPTEEDVSFIERAYAESDQRIFEIECRHCREWFELLWPMIQWPEGEPERATAYCPACGCEIEERFKAELVAGGRWRPQRPEVANHWGYRLNALISLLPNAAWPKLAAEWLKAKRGGPAELQVFTNLILAKTWRTSINRLNAEVLAGRVEPIGLDRIPEEVCLLTLGADVQDNRIESTIIGWPLAGPPCVLAHLVVDGSTLEDGTWTSFDELLRTRWRHPHGWEMRIDAAAVDSGGHEGRTQKVYDFCAARLHRRVYAIRGVGGARPIWSRAQRVKGSARLFLVGHDQIKTQVLELLAADPFDAEGRPNPHALRVSDDLSAEWFDQACGEIRRVRYVRNRAVIEFVPKRRGQRVEALDALCYAFAVRQSPAVKAIDLRARAARRPPIEGEKPPPPRASPASWAAHFNE
jgi:phage terminase large subunit GpA-like protein